MSSQSATSSNDEEFIFGPTFTCFLRLPVELQIRVWEYAFPVNPSPRVACLEVQSAPSTQLSHEVLNLNNMEAEIGWRILNPTYLAESDMVLSLLATSHRSRTITLERVKRTLDTPWLRRLCLSGAHIDPATDIVCFGHPISDAGTNRCMIGLSLVMGNELTNVMVSAELFLRHAALDLRGGTVDPVRRALATLRSVDPVWDQLFRSDGGGPLRSPSLPKNIYYFVSNPLRTPHCVHGSDSFCLHYEHLKIANWDEASEWAESYTSLSIYETWSLHLERMSLVDNIKLFWSLVKMLPSFKGREIPNIFFVEIKEQDRPTIGAGQIDF